MADPVPAPTVDREAICARAEAATAGPWFREYGDVVVSERDPRDRYEDEPRPARVSRRAAHRGMRDDQAIADAAFIAHAREDVPALLAEVSRQAAVIAQRASLDVETACEVMHDAYERAAIGAGWETNPASRKPWADVPEANKATMRAAVSALLAALDGSTSGSTPVPSDG